MIRHIVFFTAPEANQALVRKGLSKLTGIPYAERLEIGTNIKRDTWENTVDFVVYGEFKDEEALAAYKAHPDYAASTTFVKPLREMRVVADIDTGEAVTEPY